MSPPFYTVMSAYSAPRPGHLSSLFPGPTHPPPLPPSSGIRWLSGTGLSTRMYFRRLPVPWLSPHCTAFPIYCSRLGALEVPDAVGLVGLDWSPQFAARALRAPRFRGLPQDVRPLYIGLGALAALRRPRSMSLTTGSTRGPG